MPTVRRIARASVVLAALISPPASVDAAEVRPAGGGATTIFDAVTVVASLERERVGDVVGTVTVISREALDRALAQSVADAVRHEAGVSAVGQAGRFGFASFRVRGIDGNRVAVVLDGLPLREGFAVGSFANAGRGTVEPELLAALEILRGPASALHGSDALGGVVSLSTRAPGDLLGAAPDRSLEVRLGADGRDRGRRASVLAAAAFGRWQLLTLAVARDASEVDNQGDVAPDPATRRDRSGFVRAVRLFDRGQVELTVDRQEGRVETDVRHLVRGPAQFATTERLAADDRDDRTRVTVRYDFATRQQALEEGELRVAWSASDLRQGSEQWRMPDARTPSPTLRQRSFELEESAWNGAWRGRSKFDTGALSHRLTWGVEGVRATVTELRDGRETHLASGAVTQVILGERLPVRDFPRSTLRRLALFAADDVALDAGRWRLQPALRWERTSTDARPDTLYLDDFPATPIVDVDDASWTPKLGLTRELGRGHSVYAQYAQGFRAPPFHDVNVGLKIAAFGYEAIPNPQLRPERSRGAELGWRYAGARISAHLALFESRYRDLIESRANLGRDPLTGITTFQSVNRDRATIRGAEARWRVDLERVAAGARGWTLDGSAAWLEGEDTRRRQPLNSIDPATLTLAAWYLSPQRRWAASATGTWVDSKRGEVDKTTADLFAPPGYFRLDLAAEWRPSERWTVTLALLNALDRQHWSFARVRGVLADDSQLDFHSEPGRALLVGIAWKR